MTCTPHASSHPAGRDFRRLAMTLGFSEVAGPLLAVWVLKYSAIIVFHLKQENNSLKRTDEREVLLGAQTM